MTIEKGKPWGRSGPLPADGIVCDSDASVADALTAASEAARDLVPIGLVGGDLCRTLGGRGDRQRLLSEEATQLRVDAGRAELDGEMHWFAAHCVARRRWWRGRTVAVMNAAFVGSWNVAPRAHPGDGWLDIVEAELGPGDRLKARKRLTTGTHVPHPDIRQRRMRRGDWDLGPHTTVYLDGRAHPGVRHLHIEIETDLVRVVI